MAVSLNNNILSGQTDDGYTIAALSLTTESGFSDFIDSKELGEISIAVGDRSFVGFTENDSGTITVVSAYENVLPGSDQSGSYDPIINFQINQ